MKRLAIALLLAASGCVEPPYAAYQPVPADDVARLVTGSSVLISPTGDWPFETLIYFDRATQIRLLQKLTRQLAPGGYFFAGHSESLQNMDLPLVSAGPSVYRKCG